MRAVREKCAKSKRRISVFDFEDIVLDEMISSELRELEKKQAAKARRQQQAKRSPNKIQLDSVLFSDVPSKTSESNNATSVQKQWLPKLPSFLRMSTWRGGRRTSRVHNLEMS